MNPLVQQLIDQVNASLSVELSAQTYIKGVPALIDAAVKAALAGGATAAELAPFTDLSAQLKASAQATLDAIAANTPVTPVQFKAKK